MKTKTLAITAMAVLGLAVPASAGAQQLIGSGSVAAQPVLQALFAAYSKNVNPKNKLTNVSTQSLHDIYRGLLTNWSQVPGSGLETTIDPVGRDTNGGTYTFFLQAVLNNELPASNVNALTADGLVVNAVKQDPNAIGYAGLAWQKKGLKPVKVNGIACEAKNVSVDPLKYPLSRYIFLVLPTENPSPAVQKFATWARSNAEAGEIINKAGGVAAFNKKAKK